MNVIAKRLESMSPQQKVNFLRDNAETIENDKFYQRVLDTEEIQEAERNHTRDSIELTKLNEEFDVVKSDYKVKAKEVKERISVNLQSVRMGMIECKGSLYHFADQEEGMMYTFSQDGDMVESRKLRPNEKQMSIHSSLKTGTENG